MTATEIFEELERRGVELVVAGDRLRFRPREAVSPELLAALARHKAEFFPPCNPGGRKPGAAYVPALTTAAAAIRWA